MSIPIIKCRKCGYVFSLQIMQVGNTNWLDLDPEHTCKHGFECQLVATPTDPKPTKKGGTHDKLNRERW